jgi:hypothetical protein
MAASMSPMTMIWRAMEIMRLHSSLTRVPQDFVSNIG